jgi:hypothetical protein
MGMNERHLGQFKGDNEWEDALYSHFALAARHARTPPANLPGFSVHDIWLTVCA